MFRPSPENVVAGFLCPHPAPIKPAVTSGSSDQGLSGQQRHQFMGLGRITMEPTREQTRASQVQDRPPPQGQPVGPAEKPDQQARIWSRPAWPGPSEADRLPPAAD